METNISNHLRDDNTRRQIRSTDEVAIPEHEWIDIVLAQNLENNYFDFYYEISPENIEALWIKTYNEEDIQFSTTFKVFLNSTLPNEDFFGIVFSIFVTATQSLNDSESYSEIQITKEVHLKSQYQDLSVLAITTPTLIIPCVDHNKQDLSKCTKADADKQVTYLFNEYGKFIFYLQDPFVSSKYNVRLSNVLLKNRSTDSYTTLSKSVNMNERIKGELIFSFPMKMLGDPVYINVDYYLTSDSNQSRILSGNENSNDYLFYAINSPAKVKVVASLNPSQQTVSDTSCLPFYYTTILCILIMMF